MADFGTASSQINLGNSESGESSEKYEGCISDLLSLDRNDMVNRVEFKQAHVDLATFN